MALPATEAFTGTGALSANWTTATGANAWDRVSDQAAPQSNTANHLSVWTADTFNDDQYSQYVLRDTDLRHGPAVRCATGAVTCYLVTCSDGQLYSLVAGSYTALGAAFGAFANGDTAKLTVSGTTLELFKNGVSQGTRTSSAISSGSAALYGYYNTARADDWEGGNLGGGAATTRPAYHFTLLGVQ